MMPRMRAPIPLSSTAPTEDGRSVRNVLSTAVTFLVPRALHHHLVEQIFVERILHGPQRYYSMCVLRCCRQLKKASRVVVLALANGFSSISGNVHHEV